MNISTTWPDALPEQRRNIIIQRIYEMTENDEDREQWLSELETAVESDADEIESLLGA